MKMRLVRVGYTSFGTFGVLQDEDMPFCVTLEREWKDNKIGESCIPIGIYICRRIESPRFGNTFEVTGVRGGRTAILFHKGNLMDDTHGCIILGEKFDPLNGVPAVLSSGDAMNEFLNRTEKVTLFNLEIIKV